jgi:hypothetical protein
MSDWSLEQEATKAALSAGVAVVTLSLGWLVGNRLSALWALRQKRREADISAAAEFSRLYGEFIAVWKLWNYSLMKGSAIDAPDDAHWSLMERAALMEAGFEALLVRVASERVLEDSLVEELGLLRQGFQHLRECIGAREKIGWYFSEHPQYLAFKRLACLFSNLLASDRAWVVPSASEAAVVLQKITSNEHERKWAALSDLGAA